MPRKLIQKEQFSLLYHNFLPANNIDKSSLADIKHLDKIVPVRRKMYKPCVCTHRDQLALAEHLGAVHGKILTGCVEILIYLCHPVQNALFFFCDFS